MGFFSKIKDFFKAAKQDADKKLEAFEDTAQKKTTLEVKGELIGQCSLCGYAIGSEDRVRDLEGKKVHKRCLKKAKKMMFQGKSYDQMAQELAQ